MPITITDTDGGLGNIITGGAIISENEFLDTFKAHLTQDGEKFKQYRYSLSDYTNTIKLELSNKSLEIIAEYCQWASMTNPEAIVAFVADQEMVYRLAKIYEILTQHSKWEQQVFTNRKDAEAWIKQRVKEKYAIENLTLA